MAIRMGTPSQDDRRVLSPYSRASTGPSFGTSVRGIAPDDLGDGGAEVLAREREGDVRLEEPDLVAAIEAGTGKAKAVEGAVADHMRERVGELDLAARALLAAVEMLHDGGLQEIAPDDREGRGRLLRHRLLDKAAHLDELAAVVRDVEHAIAVGVGARHLHDGHHIPAGLGIGLDHLLETGSLREDEVIGEKHGKGLVIDEIARAPHSMAEAERLLLAHIGDAAGCGEPAPDLVELLELAALSQHALQLVAVIEMILDRRLAAAGDEDELLDAGRLRLLEGVLDERLVDDWQHLLRHRLGGRQETGPQPADGENGSANAPGHALRLSRLGRWSDSGLLCATGVGEPQPRTRLRLIPQQRLFRLIHFGREIGRAAGIGMELHHKTAIGVLDLSRARALGKA